MSVGQHSWLAAIINRKLVTVKNGSDCAQLSDWGKVHKAQCTPPTPTRLNYRVETRVCGVLNSQLGHDDCRRIRSTIWKLNMLRIFPSAVWSILITFFQRWRHFVVTCHHLQLDRPSLTMIGSTAQKIVNWVATADGCVHATDTTQLDFVVGNFVQTRRDCRQLPVVAKSIHSADATQLDS